MLAAAFREGSLGLRCVALSAVRWSGVLIAFFLFLAMAHAAPGADMAEYKQQKAEAEKLFAAGTYQKAHDLYAQVKTKELPAFEQRWVAFRVADTEWRSVASSSNR